MIKLLYSNKSLKELELRGSNAELSELREVIARFAKSDETTISITADSDFDPSPYEQSLTTIQLSKSTGPLVIKVQNSNLFVSGNSTSLNVFADNLPYNAKSLNSIRYHVHFERIGREQFISENSLGIVLALDR